MRQSLHTRSRLSAFGSDPTPHADHLAAVAERLANVARAVHQVATAQGDCSAASLAAELLGSIERERCALGAHQGSPPAAPKPDSIAANSEPHDEVEEASMESFPASDPPATRHHTD